MAKELVLVGASGQGIGQRHALQARNGTVGSSSMCEIVLNDRTIEPRHAEVQQMLDRWFITPLGTGRISVNGMPVNGRSRINHGDRVTLGSVSFEVEVAELREQEFGGGVTVSNLPRLGDYFVRRGYVSDIQVAAIAKRQSELRRNGTQSLFGQVAYDLGYISRSQLDTALADQRVEFNQRFLD